MTYTPTAWVDYNPPCINAVNLNHMEYGIYHGLAHSGKVRNVAQFRAENPGSTTGGIQEAIDDLPVGGGMVFIPYGVYTITTPINIPNSHITIRGAGRRATWLGMGADCNVFEAIGVTTVPGPHLFDITIEDLGISGNARAWAGDGIHLENCHAISLNRLQFGVIKGHAIYGLEVWDSFFSDIQTLECGDDVANLAVFHIEGRVGGPTSNVISFIGIQFFSSYHGGIEFKNYNNKHKIVACKFNPSTPDEACWGIYFNDDNAESCGNVIADSLFGKEGVAANCGLGIDIKGAIGTQISNCAFFDHPSGAIRLQDESGLLISNCYFLWSGDTSPIIDIDGSEAVIENCEMYNGTYGIDISGTGVQVDNCRIKECQNDGIRVVGAGPRRVTVRGCHIWNCGDSGAGSGIYINGGEDCVVDGNTCYDDQGIKTQEYGVKSDATADRTVLTSNILTDNLTGAYLLAGANNEIGHNITA